MRSLSYQLASLGLALALLGCKGEVARSLPSTASSQLQSDAHQCDKGDLMACHNVALAFDFGEARSAEGRVLAAKLYTRACDASLSLSCRRLADLQVEAAGGDLRAALPVLQRTCEQGDVDSCSDAAEILILTDDVEGGMAAYFDLCHRASSRACIELGRHTLEGTAGSADPVAAAAILDQHCVNGSPVACYYRAEALLAQTRSADAIGREITQLLGHACIGGEALGCRRLAGLHRSGVGVVEDREYARSLLRMSCEHSPLSECDAPLPPPTWPPLDERAPDLNDGETPDAQP